MKLWMLTILSLGSLIGGWLNLAILFSLGWCWVLGVLPPVDPFYGAITLVLFAVGGLTNLSQSGYYDEVPG